MPERAAANVGLRQLLHSNGCHHASINALLLQDILKQQSVDHGTEHPHVVGGDAIHSHRRELSAAHDVAAANNKADSRTHFDHALDLVAEHANAIKIETETFFTGQCFAGQL